MALSDIFEQDGVTDVADKLLPELGAFCQKLAVPEGHKDGGDIDGGEYADHLLGTTLAIANSLVNAVLHTSAELHLCGGTLGLTVIDAFTSMMTAALSEPVADQGETLQ